jgi:hypothetical protein
MRTGLLGLFLMMLMAPAALAQTGKHVALGGSIGFTKYIDKDFSSANPTASLAYRIRLNPEGTDGWSWALKSGLGWSKRKTAADIGGIDTQLGKLQTVLIMGGVQRALRKGPWQVGFGIVAGPSINSFEVDQGARDAYLSRLGSTLTDVKVKSSLAVRPDISAWYDLSKWFALQGSIGYLFNRPKAETTLSGVTTSSTWKTDHASVSVGLVVGIF